MTPAAVKLLMRISASRLDPAIAPGAFVDMVLELVELTHQTAIDVDDVDTPATVDKPGVGPASVDPADRQDQVRRDTPAHLHRRAAIQLEAEGARDDDGKLPRGFIQNLAEKHGVHPKTIRNILAD